jgi:hypothetical protein
LTASCAASFSIASAALQRRAWLGLASRLAGGGLLLFSSGCALAQPSFRVSKKQMTEAIARRFPRSVPVAGLLALRVDAPELRLLPEQNRLGAAMPVSVGGQALRRDYAGLFDVDFGLRFEPSDQSIRAQQLRVNALRFDDLPPRVTELLQAYGAPLAEQTLQDAVLHTLKPEDLALSDAMGLQPEAITVTNQGLVVRFAAKPAR